MIWSDTDTSSGNLSKAWSGVTVSGDYYLLMWISSGSGTYSFGNETIFTTFLGVYTSSSIYALTKIFIGDNVTTILVNSFYYHYSLNEIIFTDDLLSIGESSFRTCSSLKYVYIPDNVTSIAIYAFYYDYSLEYVRLSSNITTIDNYTFGYCTSLSKVIFPAGLTTINTYAFRHNYNNIVYDFTNSSAVITLSDFDAFQTLSALTIFKVPSSLETAWKAATNWSTYADYIVGV